MKKILSLVVAFACGISVWAQEAAAPAADAAKAPEAAPAADAAKAPEQVPELEATSSSGNQITALDFVLGLGYNYRKFHAVKQFSRNVGGYYIGGGAGGAGISSTYRDLQLRQLDRQIQQLLDRMARTPSGRMYDSLERRLNRLEERRWRLEEGVMNDNQDISSPRVFVGNEEVGMTECFGYELNFLLPFYKNDGIRLAAALGYQYYDLDTKTTSMYGSSSFEFQMHTYDVGVKLTYELFDSFDLVATIGPSFNLIDMESRSYGVGDSSTRMKMGVFGAVGAQYWIRPWLGVSAELRYDKVFSDAVTRYAEMKLDTWNTDIKLVFLF